MTVSRILLGAAFLLSLAGCRDEVQPAPEPPLLAPSAQLELLEGDGFSIRYPANARIEIEGPRPPVRGMTSIIGPSVGIRPADAEWEWWGPAYRLDLLTYDNPGALTAEAWVRENILADSEALIHDTQSAVVAGELAVRVSSFGGDSEIITYYLARERQVVALQYADIPLGNSPIAPVQQDVHTLLLSTFRFEPNATVAADPGQARAAARTFYELLHTRRYAEATALYGGSYEVLQGWNPDLDPRDHAALVRAGCERNGLQCLPLHDLVGEEALSPSAFRFTVRFRSPDGGLFIRGPCCGETEESMPSESEFPVRVRRDRDRFLVQDLPVYVP